MFLSKFGAYSGAPRFRGSWPYLKISDQAGKAFWGERFKLSGLFVSDEEKKSFRTMIPGANVIKLFTAVIYKFP